MKKILFSLSLVSLLFSCSSNDSDENKAKEELSAIVVEKSINIQGATKKTGTPPATNGDLSFETKASTANIEEGFFIEIDTEDDIDGVYIQLVDENGKPSETYIDVPSSSFKSSDDIIEPNFGASGGTNKTKKTDGDTDLIDVDFDVDLAPGEFCYFICIYNEETGFVSAPTEICVTVIDWGGNNDFTGTWIPNPEDTDNDFIDNCVTLNEFYPAIECNNGTEFIPEGEICFDYLFELGLETSGDFAYEIAWDYKTIDFEASEEQCTTVFESTKFDFSYIGKWSYDATSEVLTLVLNAIVFDGETITYDEGILLYSNKASLENGKLIFEDDFINTEFIKK